MATEAPAKDKTVQTTERAEAVDRMAEGPLADDPKNRTPEQKQDQGNATAWFMSTDEEEVGWAWVPMNVAPAGAKENIVQFKVQVVGREKIRALRKESERTLQNGERETDEMEANLKIAVEGLLEPNIKGDPKLRVVRGQEFLDPGDALQARFAHKPGLIDQLANQIVQISGYNDADVKEIRAAGN